MSNLITLVIFSCLILLACSESFKLTSQQTAGKKIFESLCDKCHQLINPNKHTDTEWISAVNLYGSKLKLQQSEKDAVIAYLTFVNDN